MGDARHPRGNASLGVTCLIANTRSELSIISIPKRTEDVRLPIGNGPEAHPCLSHSECGDAAFQTGSQH
jgi:hypothetical protein